MGDGTRLDQATYVDAVRRHSAGFAAAAAGHLGADVPACPGWRVADLVAHLSDVHWSWATIVQERRREPVPPADRPPRAPDDELLDRFTAGAERLCRVLGGCDPSTPVWTWAPGHEDAGFVVRHQVQEAMVHHRDVAEAAGLPVPELEPDLSADAVDEFLTVSVATEADPADDGTPGLAGRILLCANDTGDRWEIREGPRPETLRVTRTAPEDGGPTGDDAAVLTASAADLLLWLYGRVALDVPDVHLPLLERFRTLTWTD
ncbi:maleylpyruvate isomerase family mycothiol-dependent enzyme [Lapillicoccus jejuensis]|uniref:Uncharacterized protein (TIGR03083 family) n=1 Tax=Lapillicoccus jejuensis TaxID=402171 RepID=A0A542E3K2_9MICO|nr:maleylpyruvate isomerase family mycothiol-dependent enzyme [Lapillicoccus jejuensis]TQJ09879.1 uncharacterized protein (TIGR03083 family) [Lapillicoccus jejuensis]